MPKQASEYVGEKRLKYLLCGEPGTGKSILAASAAAWGKTYVADIDGRFASVHNFYKGKPEFENLYYDTFNFFGRETQAARELAETLMGFQKVYKETGKSPYNTVILDSWTNWESLMLSKIMGDTPKLERKHVDFGPLVFAAPDGKNDYLLHAQGQKMFIKQLMGITAPMNVIVVAHTKIIYDKFDRPLLKISAAGKLESQIGIDFDEVHLLKFESHKRKLCLKHDSFPIKTTMQTIPENGLIEANLAPLKDMAFIEL